MGLVKQADLSVNMAESLLKLQGSVPDCEGVYYVHKINFIFVCFCYLSIGLFIKAFTKYTKMIVL